MFTVSVIYAKPTANSAAIIDSINLMLSSMVGLEKLIQAGVVLSYTITRNN